MIYIVSLETDSSLKLVELDDNSEDETRKESSKVKRSADTLNISILNKGPLMKWIHCDLWHLPHTSVHLPKYIQKKKNAFV